MFHFSITDRRLNPGGKSLTNRRRFLERVKHSVRDAANRHMKSRAIADDKSEAEVTISRDGIDEPQFRYNSTNGTWDVVLPGNREYIVGDTIPKPQGGNGSGTEGSPDGEGQDDFRFYISYDEFVNAILEDLSLPDMVKSSQKQIISYTLRRAGYTTVGTASNLALEKTMIMGIARRISLKTPKLTQIEELEALLEDEMDDERHHEIEDAIAELRRRADTISFLEKADLRYNNYVKQAKPITQAVMILIIDVSGSMGEHEKTIAKKFFVLLYLFLRRKYKDIDVVFIRHTHQAAEVDEETFFHAQDTGGTLVSSAYDVMYHAIHDRYNINEWNIYMAQASDGDNTDSDNVACIQKLSLMLPWFQYATYLEIGHNNSGSGFVPRASNVWQMMENLQSAFNNLAMRRITEEAQVIETFRSLFETKKAPVAA